MPQAGAVKQTATCAITRDELLEVVDEIFSSMAGMTLSPTAERLKSNKRGGSIVSAVQIVGAWQGAVRLDIDLELARDICGRLLGLEPSALSSDDIRDAAGELANMTGGSIKTLIAPTCSLSLPSVVVGQDYEFCVLQGKTIQEASFSHESGRLMVSILEKYSSS